MNILLVAEESAGARVLRAVATSPHRLTGVLTESAPDTAIARAAAQHRVPMLPARLVRDAAFAAALRDDGVDLLLNVHSLYVMAAEVIAAPRIGSFNLHPGPLPEYAGLNVPSWAIYQGETMHAVTLHWLVPRIDAGPVAYRAPVAIDEHDTGFTLSAKCTREGVPLVRRLVEVAATGPDAIPRVPQDLSRRRYYGRRVPGDGWIDWTDSARRIVDFVRASTYAPFPSPWGQPRARIGDQVISVLKATRTGEPCSASPGTMRSAAHGVCEVAARDEWVSIRRGEPQPATAPTELSARLNS